MHAKEKINKDTKTNTQYGVNANQVKMHAHIHTTTLSHKTNNQGRERDGQEA